MVKPNERPRTGLSSLAFKKTLESISPLPNPVINPVLVITIGLPGTGKSYLSRRLSELVPLAIVESDGIRKRLFHSPTYSLSENRYLFHQIHKVLKELLIRGISVFLDATNLREADRRKLYTITNMQYSRLILLHLKAPANLVRDRLNKRSLDPNRKDHSDANWNVYLRMRGQVDPIRRRHYTIDTSNDITNVVIRIADEIQKMFAYM
jgi:predicted kinase